MNDRTCITFRFKCIKCLHIIDLSIPFVPVISGDNVPLISVLEKRKHVEYPGFCFACYYCNPDSETTYDEEGIHVKTVECKEEIK